MLIFPFLGGVLMREKTIVIILICPISYQHKTSGDLKYPIQIMF